MSDSLAVEYCGAGGVGIKTQKVGETSLPGSLGGATFLSREIIQSKRDWTTRNSMSALKTEGKSRAKSNWSRHLVTGRWRESKVTLSLQKGRE